MDVEIVIADGLSDDGTRGFWPGSNETIRDSA